MSATVKTFFVSPRSGRIADSTLCQYFFLGAQASGNLRDSMGGASATKFDGSFTDGEAWANAGFATTVSGGATTDYFTRVAGAGHDFTLVGKALIFALRIKKATPVGNEIILGSFTSGSVYGGLQMTATSTGSLQLACSPIDGSGNQTAAISSTYPTLDGTEHFAMYAFGPDAVSVKQYVDGLPASTSGSGNASGKDCAGGNILNIGASRAGSAKDAQFGSIQQYNVPCATLASLQTDAVAQWIFRNPHRPVPDWMWGL